MLEDCVYLRLWKVFLVFVGAVVSMLPCIFVAKVQEEELRTVAWNVSKIDILCAFSKSSSLEPSASASLASLRTLLSNIVNES